MGSGHEWSSEDQRDIVILGLVSIRCISDKSVVAVEIDFTWSFGFVSVDLEAQISLMMIEFSSCLLVDSTINLDNDSSIVSLRAYTFSFTFLICLPRLLSWAWIAASPSEVSVLLKVDRTLANSIPRGLEFRKASFLSENTPFESVEWQYAVLISQNTQYCLEEQIRRLDCKNNTLS
nr:hypothetical protein [Tanacetum cinerariifolium]